MSNKTIDNNKNSSINLSFDTKQVNRIIEALLFSSSINIGAEWAEEDYKVMIDLAKELKQACNNDVTLNRICFYKEKNYEDNWTEDILTNFKKYISTVNLETVKK